MNLLDAELINEKELLQAERKWFEITRCCDRSYGYNLAIDPTNNRPSQETKDKISKLKTGQGNAFYGKKHSAEECERMSDRASGSKNPNAKLSDFDISEIYNLLKNKTLQSNIAKKFNIHVSTVERLASKFRERNKCH